MCVVSQHKTSQLWEGGKYNWNIRGLQLMSNIVKQQTEWLLTLMSNGSLHPELLNYKHLQRNGREVVFFSVKISESIVTSHPFPAMSGASKTIVSYLLLRSLGPTMFCAHGSTSASEVRRNFGDSSGRKLSGTPSTMLTTLTRLASFRNSHCVSLPSPSVAT